MKALQVVGVEHRQALAGIEDEGNAGGRELLGVADHAVATVRRDDADLDVPQLCDTSLTCECCMAPG